MANNKQMRIELDKGIYFNSDAYSCWVTRERKSKGKKESVIVDNLSGYHGNITLLFHAIADKALFSKRDLASLKQVAEHQAVIHKEISAWGAALNEAFSKKRGVKKK
jgi:hypothetical protein